MKVFTLNVFIASIIHLALIVAIISIIRIVFALVINKIYLRKQIQKNEPQTRIQRRVQTIIEVENNLAISIAIIIGFFILLNNFFDIQPLLASAGIFGLAVSFGAQSLVKDIITGFFFLIQDQFGVGDTVQVGLLVGVIIDITLRTITIRDLSGNVTTFSNSSITQITNLSKDWSMFDMTFIISANNPVDQIISIMQQAGENIEQEEKTKPFILGKTEVLGLESLSDGKMGIRINIKTSAGRQIEIGRAYRYQMKKLLEEQGINL